MDRDETLEIPPNNGKDNFYLASLFPNPKQVKKKQVRHGIFCVKLHPACTQFLSCFDIISICDRDAVRNRCHLQICDAPRFPKYWIVRSICIQRLKYR